MLLGICLISIWYGGMNGYLLLYYHFAIFELLTVYYIFVQMPLHILCRLELLKHLDIVHRKARSFRDRLLHYFVSVLSFCRVINLPKPDFLATGTCAVDRVSDTIHAKTCTLSTKSIDNCIVSVDSQFH